MMLLTAPTITHAAWYWLVNQDNPELGDFVELSALQYAETTVSKDLLLYLGNDFRDLMSRAEHSSKCNQRYHSIRATLQAATTVDDIPAYLENNLRACLDREVKEMEEKHKLEELETALQGCDYGYFDTKLSDGQKVTYHKELSKCKDDGSPETMEEAQELVLPQQPVTQIAPPTETYIAPRVLDTPPPVAQTSLERAVTIESAQASSENDSTSLPQEGGTEEHREEIFNQAITSSEPVQKSTFFQKVISFFVNLFPW